MTDYWIDNVRIENSYTYDNDWVNGSKTDLVAVHVVAGKIAAIISQDEFVKNNMQATYSGDSLLMLPSLTDKHVHLDKLKIGEPWTPIRPAKNIVERFEQEIPDINRLSSSMQERAEKMIDLEKQHGVTTIRSHVDIEPMTDLRHFKVIKKVAENSDIKIEIVAFPQHGLLRSQSYDLVSQALQSGADFIGGVDPYGLDQDYKKSLGQTFELADKYHAGVDIHVHDRNEAGTKTIKEIIRLTEHYHLQDKVFISHAFGLNDFVGEERQSVFDQLAALHIHIVTSVPLDAGTIPPIIELIQAGVQVHVGNDNVNDSWSPYGTGSVQDKLARLGEMFSVNDQVGLTQLLGLVTDGKVTLDAEGNRRWPVVGDDANFMIVDASCAAEFVARQSAVDRVSYLGRFIDE